LIVVTFARGSASGAPASGFCLWVAAGRATVLIKLLSRKSLLHWQGLVLAAPRAPAQRPPPQRQNWFLGLCPKNYAAFAARSKAHCALTRARRAQKT